MFEGPLQLLVLQPQAPLFFRNHFLPFHSHSNVSRTFLRPRFVGTQSKLELQLEKGYNPKSLRHHEPGCNGLEVFGHACLGMHRFKIQLHGKKNSPIFLLKIEDRRNINNSSEEIGTQELNITISPETSQHYIRPHLTTGLSDFEGDGA
ncbi:hypothetical protein P8452_72461 [Trifolium repens]|nr:hypothetical protein P8452_72461 [Trifolium repens]